MLSDVLARPDVVCQWRGCGVSLRCPQGRGRNPKWCDEHRRLRKLSESKDSPSRFCSENDCVRPLRAQGLCNMHYKRVMRANGRIAQSVWDERRRTNHQKRRARKKGATVSSVSLRVVAERDGFLCGICSSTVDMDLLWPDPMSKSLDHILPLSRGGDHSYENCQLSHLLCNVSKGASVQ